MFPLVMALRAQRASGVDVATALQFAWDQPTESDLVDTVRPVIIRFSGFGEFLPLLQANRSHPELIVPALRGQPSIGHYTTVSVFGYDESDPMGIAPGVLGWLYVAVGLQLLPVAVCVLLCFIELLWRFALSLRLSSQPVAVSMIASFTILLLVDGMIEDTLLLIMVLC